MGTIFMIHGMWGGPWYWENYRRFFGDLGYTCTAATLRHHDMDPGSFPPDGLGTTSLLDYAEDLEKEILQLDEKPIIMGHSMGGLLAQILGSRGLAQSLVLLNPASPAGIMALKYSVIKSFLSSMSKWGFWRKPIKPRFEETAYSVLNLMPLHRQKEIYQKLVHESGKAAFEIGFWLLDRNRASKVDESRISCPVLVIAGEKDRITPLSVNRKVAEKYKAVSELAEFKDHAHWSVGEPGWEDIAGFIAEWLKKNSY